jgi:hypothetical protein
LTDRARGVDWAALVEPACRRTIEIIRRGTPAVLLGYSDYEPSYVDGKQVPKLYVWNGKRFAYDPRYDCRETEPCLQPEPIASTPCSVLR